MATNLMQTIDRKNYAFTSGVKERLRDLSRISEQGLEWLSMEHYQFSFANKDLLECAIASTAKLREQGVSAELRRNVAEEDGHAPMYKRGMLAVGTDFDTRKEFEPTTRFLERVKALTGPCPSRALGALYATETAAIFEHEVFFDICREICRRRNAVWEGSVIKAFHDLHLSGGVEQGHKDGLGIFLDREEEPGQGAGEPIDKAKVLAGANEAIDVMQAWWTALVNRVTT
jgi:hypothetical protein